MNKALIASFLVAAGLAVSASAETTCSAFVNLMGIAANQGGSAVVIDTVLSNGAEFILFADSSEEVVSFMVDDNTVKEFKDWYEDGLGTGTLENDDGDTCVINCNSGGGLIVTVTGSAFSQMSWKVKASGGVSMNGDTCGCSGGAGAISQNRPCNTTTCSTSANCRVPASGPAQGSCQSGTVPN